MNKNTTLITAITALFVAFLVLTTACLPAGNTDLSNLTEVKATYKSLLLDDAETHKHNEEQEIDTYVSKDETHQEAYKPFCKSIENIKRKQVEKEFSGKGESKKKKEFDFSKELKKNLKIIKTIFAQWKAKQILNALIHG